MSDMEERGDQAHYELEVPGKGYKLYASGHYDKTPMALVHTAGTSMAGPPRKRVYRYYDREEKRNRSVILTLMQP